MIAWVLVPGEIPGLDLKRARNLGCLVFCRRRAIAEPPPIGPCQEPHQRRRQQLIIVIVIIIIWDQQHPEIREARY